MIDAIEFRLPKHSQGVLDSLINQISSLASNFHTMHTGYGIIRPCEPPYKPPMTSTHALYTLGVILLSTKIPADNS